VSRYRIRPLERAASGDLDALRVMSQEVVDAGEMFVYRDTDAVLGYWLDASGTPFLAGDESGAIAGTYVVKPNQPGRGDHVANAGYMVAESHRGCGLGRLLGEHSLETARRAGYRAMQFNFVVAVNEPALRLWHDLGFRVVGTQPEAFRHDVRGFLDAHVLYREL